MKLVIFDCDGTLVDSQNAIFAAMQHAFGREGLPVPPRHRVLEVVGLSLPEAFAVLAGEHARPVQTRLAEAYRTDFPRAREEVGERDPLFEGTAELIAALFGAGDVMLGIATGKSRRGVARLLAQEGWEGHFATIQTADTHPSKPHPSMIETAMRETGVGPERTVMIGDTSFDMEMARAAGVGAIGVSWGYHPVERLESAGAHRIVAAWPDLHRAIAGCLDAAGARR
ncbi:MAG TPA: HAD-IA family hydrolase [Hyphomicrobiaceae bacterium]|nr:HAD-IA family hydrolase [Hyphomicrobiaceae bacterium]